MSASDVSVGSDSFTGNYGLSVGLATAAEAYVQDDTPAAEPRYRARFYVNPTMLGQCANSCRMKVFAAYSSGSAEIFAVTLKESTAGGFKMEVQAYDGGSTISKNYGLDRNGWSAIEIDWSAATSGAGNDGYLDVWVNGTAKSGQAGIDTDALAVDSVRLGNPDGHDFASGTVEFDDFESRRDSYVGLITDQPLASPYQTAPTASPSANPPTLRWTEVPGATEYRVYLWNLNTSQYEALEFRSGTTFTPPAALNPNHDYRWRVRTYSDGGAGPNSPWFNFSYATNPPGKPNAQSPKGPQTTNPPTFQWTAVSGADKYRLLVRDKDTGQYVIDEQPTSNSYTPPAPLDPTHIYQWKVRAHNGAGWGVYDDWEIFDFSTGPPASPTLLSPEGTLGTNPPTFRWSEIPGVDRYRIYVWNIDDGRYQPEGFKQNVSDATEFTPATPLDPTKNYRFKVKAHNSSGWGVTNGWMYFDFP